MEVAYPPEPWRLYGQLSMSLWFLPREHVPATPEGTSPILLGGRGVIGTAWIVYGVGSVMEYNELLLAVLVRRSGRPRACITHIWVDSEASKQGGRELWGIPKEMATFSISETDPWRAEACGIVTTTMADRLGLPGTWPLRYKIAQRMHGKIKESTVRIRSRVAVRRASWHVDNSGPLAWLRHHRPFLSLALRDFKMRFGDAPGDSAAR